MELKEIIERAKAGEAIQFMRDAMHYDGPKTWEDVHFVGLSQCGTPIIQFNNGSLLITPCLRLKPVDRVVWAIYFADEASARATGVFQFNAISPDHVRVVLRGEE